MFVKSAVQLNVKAAVAPASAAAARPAAAATSSPLFDVRRMRLRSEYRRDGPLTDSDADSWLFPRERLGRSYDLNWALCKYAIVPQHEAFRNADPRVLLMYASRLSPARAAVAPSSPRPQVSVVGHNLSQRDFDAAHVALRKALAKRPALFVHDAAVGASPALHARARVVTSDATVALTARALLSRLPLPRGASAQDFDEHLLVLSDPQSPPMLLVDPVRALALLGGTLAPAALRDALVSAALPRLLLGDRLLVTADLVRAQPGHVELVLGGDDALLRDAALVGAHEAVWGAAGAARAYDGVSFAGAAGWGDVQVEGEGSARALGAGGDRGSAVRRVAAVRGGGKSAEEAAEAAVRAYRVPLAKDTAEKAKALFVQLARAQDVRYT